MNGVDFAAVVLKGFVERGDGAAYFGSTANYAAWRSDVINRGWIEDTEELGKFRVTAEGERAYADLRLDRLPRTGRASEWDWSVTR